MSAFLEPNSFIASLLSEADQQAIYQQVILQINTVLSFIKYSYKQLERFNKTNRFYHYDGHTCGGKYIVELVPDPAGVGRFGVAGHGVPVHRHNRLIIFVVAGHGAPEHRHNQLIIFGVAGHGAPGHRHNQLIIFVPLILFG